MAEWKLIKEGLQLAQKVNQWLAKAATATSKGAEPLTGKAGYA